MTGLYQFKKQAKTIDAPVNPKSLRVAETNLKTVLFDGFQGVDGRHVILVVMCIAPCLSLLLPSFFLHRQWWYQKIRKICTSV